MSLAMVAGWLIVCVPLFWTQDSMGYLAAGERLNQGHALYALVPGDRWVDIHPPYWSHPFLYPPLWGIVWRVLANPVGLALWMSVVSVAMLWWAWRASERSPLLVAVLAPSFGVLLASGNVAGLFLVGMFLVPSLSQRSAGITVGIMGAVKVMPAVLIVWFVATRQWKAAAWAAGTGLALTLGAFLLMPSETIQYVREVIPATKPMGLGDYVPWLAYPVLVIGCLVILRTRSFAVAVFTVVFGAPAVGVAGLAQLGAQVGQRPRVLGEPDGRRGPSVVHA